jgi:peroxiredoxin
MTTVPTYADQRDQLNEALATQAPAELLTGFADAAGRLAAVDFARRAPQVGDRAPDFALPDQTAERIYLSSLLRRGPVVLIFYRGEWCPYCNLQLRTFQAQLDELAEHGAQLVAISPQTPDHSLSMAEKNDLGFLVLSDVRAEVIDRYGLRYEVDSSTRELLKAAGNDVSEYNGPAGWTLPAVATFVLDPGGVIRYAEVSGDWRERAEPTAVLDVLSELAMSDAA